LEVYRLAFNAAMEIYEAVFINKLSDAGREACETQTWLEFSLACKYIDKDIFERLNEKYEYIFAMPVTMERKSASFCKVR
jgi:four helix bundle protein